MTASKLNPAVHVWSPDLCSIEGGIQAFSRNLLDALCSYVPAPVIRLLLRKDLPEEVYSHNGVLSIGALGTWRKFLTKSCFASQCLMHGWHERPQVIVSTHLNFGPIAEIIRHLAGVPYVLVAHGIDAWQVNGRLRKHALLNADLVLTVSRYTRDRLIHDIGLDAERIRVLPNTFSPERFSVSEKPSRLLQKFGLTQQTPLILTVCRLADAERYKGYDQILKALPRILQDFPDARYMLVGSGSDRTRIERLVARLGLERAVILAGFVSNEELPEYYNLCDVFAMPSKGEGFGIVYLEALASGKPVLAGNKDGSRDAIADGELGILVDPDNPAEIASEIVRVLQRRHPHPNIYRPQLLRQRVTELFGFEKFKSTVAEHLQSFLQRDS